MLLTLFDSMVHQYILNILEDLRIESNETRELINEDIEYLIATTQVVWPKLFFCKQLSFVVHK